MIPAKVTLIKPTMQDGQERIPTSPYRSSVPGRPGSGGDCEEVGHCRQSKAAADQKTTSAGHGQVGKTAWYLQLLPRWGKWGSNKHMRTRASGLDGCPRLEK
jgi:hypothetical protein